MSEYRVVRYDKHCDVHMVRELKDCGALGESLLVDLLVDGEIQSGSHEQRKNLVGEVVSIDNLSPFMYTGIGVKLVSSKK